MGSAENIPRGAGSYTCRDYRREMMLLGLRKRLAGQGLSEEERAGIERAVCELEAEMGMA